MDLLPARRPIRRFFRNSEVDVEQRMRQELLEEEARKLEAKSKALRQLLYPNLSSNPSSSTNSQNPNTKSDRPPSKPAPETLTQEQIDALVLPRQEVISRLRSLEEPITLFGEDDDARLDRLKDTLKDDLFVVRPDMTEEQINGLMRVLKKRKNDEGELEDGDGGRAGGEGEISGDGESSGVDIDVDLKLMKANFEDLCNEDKILVFFKKLLLEWKQELNDTTDTETFKQCARYLHPLFELCRKKVLPDDICQALLVVVNYCMKRDYLAAMDQYIKMAIGNAPCPIGVTVVGIHERSAREKIHTSSVAHIMNDETARKFLQSVKRLMTFCQLRYPAMPSKAVEFSSLANGSYLQFLLAEEVSPWWSRK